MVKRCLRIPIAARNVLAASLIAGLAVPGLEAVETLSMNRAVSAGRTPTSSTAFEPVESVTNTAVSTGDVVVMASFSARPTGSFPGRAAGEWRLVSGAQQSSVMGREMSDSRNDFGVINLVWLFTDLDPGAVVTLEHRLVQGSEIGTEGITLVTIPMTTEPAGAVLDHDLADQGTFVFTNAATDFVPVERADGSSVLVTVQVAPMTVERDVYIASVLSATRPVLGPDNGLWKLQYNEVSQPPADECQDGIDVGTTIGRTLSGNTDVGAVMLYAIAENLDPGTYEFRLCTASLLGTPIETFNSSLLAFALHFVGNGVGGNFPRIQSTVAQGLINRGGTWQPVPGLAGGLTLTATSDVLLAMSFNAAAASGGRASYGDFETCIEDSNGDFPFGSDQAGSSQEVRRRFTSISDLGAAGQVGLAIGLGTGDYTARACSRMFVNPGNVISPNLAGFVGRSIDDLTVPVTLAWFSASGSDSGYIEWATATEVGNLGFHLYGIENQAPRRLNRELIPARALDSTAPAGYRFQLRDFQGDEILLEDVDVTGRSRFHGPFRIGKTYGELPPAPRPTDWGRIRLNRGGRSKSGDLAGQRGTSVAGKSLRQANVNLSVDHDGIYRLTHQNLLAAGIDLSGVSTARLALLNRGKAVPIRVGGPERFGAGSFLEFVGQALDTLYTQTNVYSLEIGSRFKARVHVDPRVPPAGEPPEFYQAVHRQESNRLYDFAAPGDSPWYDTRLLAVSEPVEATYDLNLEGWSEGSGPLGVTVMLWGVTNFPQAPDHHVVVEVNGVELADEWFDGLQHRQIELQVPELLLEPSGNTLTLRLPHDTGALYDLVNYDYSQVRYPRRFQAVDGRIRFTSQAPVFRVDSLPSDDVVVYRVWGERVELLEGAQVTGGPGGYSVTFPGSHRPATYYVAAAEALRVPEAGLAVAPVNLHSGDAELLILSHPDFLDGLEPLIRARQDQGYSVRVFDVRQIYQSYADGIFDPEAIRTFIRAAHERLATEYVLLVGGDTYDYHGYLETGALSFLPTLYAHTGRGVRYAPVDPLFGDVDGDRVPDLAIGRLPVRDLYELEVLIDKTLDYGLQAGSRSVVAAADAFDTMSNTSFSDISESLIANLSESWEIERAYIDDAGLDSAREVLLDSLDAGVSVASYVGHSGPAVWSFQGLFDLEDAEALGNVGRPSVVTQWGCWNTYFVSPSYDSLAHALLLSGDQGAAAVLGATTLTQTASEQALGARFFQELATPGVTIGAALRDAKQALASAQPGLMDVLLGWTLLGDPTLVVEP